MSTATAGTLHTFRGVTMTTTEWSERLGIDSSSMLKRLARYGDGHPRAFVVGSMSGANQYGRDCDPEVFSPDVHGGEPERFDRSELIHEVCEVCPELLADGTPEDAEATAAVWVRLFGPMGLEEVGQVLGVTRQRIDQIQAVALKKMRLRGGRQMRETWEHVTARADISWAEACELIAWGVDDEDDE